MNVHECSWMVMSTPECCTMAPIALGSTNEHLWAIFNLDEHGSMVPWVLMSTQEQSWHHGNTLLSTPEYPQVLMSTHKSSLSLRSAHECPVTLFNNNHKCWFLKWPLCSILPITQSGFDQIIKTWIFLKSTRKGLLKNVQDGISRPLGSREIQKTKVETVLWDTLYFR